MFTDIMQLIRKNNSAYSENSVLRLDKHLDKPKFIGHYGSPREYKKDNHAH